MKAQHLFIFAEVIAYQCLFFTFSHAQNNTYSNIADFDANATCPLLIDSFDSYSNGQSISQLFGGVIEFNSPVPTTFFGGWGSTNGQFTAGALIPEPRFQGKSLVINFPSPVLGVGANVFDDYDGTPPINVITLTVTTVEGNTFSISENSQNNFAGFLGATSSDGITTAKFSIDVSNGNLEIDFLRVIQRPSAEVCNGVDDDCDGLIDEGVKLTFYADAESDGYGNPNVTTEACSPLAGYVSDSTDCNDGNAAIHPGAIEVCNNVDDNCNGQIDEGVKTTFYVDADGDGYGNPNLSTQACIIPNGYVSNNTDCNDANASVHPWSIEICNSIDDNCDGAIDNFVSVNTVPPIIWQKAVGGSSTDVPSAIRHTTDGGVIVAGYSGSSDGDVDKNYYGSYDYWVVKLDADSNISWTKNFGGTGNDQAEDIALTSDDGYIIAGWSNSTDKDISGHHGTTSNYDYWIVKINAAGDTMWTKSLGGDLDDVAYSVQQTNDGGYIIAGYSFSNNGDVVGGHHGTTTYYDYWIVKLTSSGAIKWQKSLGGSLEDGAFSVIQTDDGGFIAAGFTNSSDGDVAGSVYHGNGDYWIVKLDSLGGISWQYTYGGSGIDYPSSIKKTPNGGYIVVGQSYSIDGDITGHHGNTSAPDYWIVKLDHLGNLEWQKSYGGTSDDEATDVIVTLDGGYLVSGHTLSLSGSGDVVFNHGGWDIWLLKLDLSGNIIWQKSLGGSNHDLTPYIDQDANGNIVLTGQSGSNDGDVSGQHGDGTTSDYWIVKLYNAAVATSATITPSGTVNVCSGTTVIFTANTGNGITYQWKKGNGNISGATTSTYSTKKAGSYKVYETNTFGCNSTSPATTLNENPIPTATITPLGNLNICQTGSVVLQANAGTGLTYQWKKGSANISGATKQTYTATVAATYKVVVTNSSGCSKTSAGVKVTKSCREENEAPNVTPAIQLSLYPNPTSGNFTIELTIGDESITSAKVQVMNLIGQVVYYENVSVANGELKKEISPDPNSSSGMYLVRVIVNDKIYSGQIVYQK